MIKGSISLLIAAAMMSATFTTFAENADIIVSTDTEQTAAIKKADGIIETSDEYADKYETDAFVKEANTLEQTIKIGDYVQMGTYYGEPILWRCVDIDENGPLMFSDKIICIKPFDAAGDNTIGSHGRAGGRKSNGSNYWADSNMRSWLNSSASAGNVTWLCGNPPNESHVLDGCNEYDQEAGFLTNFSQNELSAIKEVTQKSIVAYPEYNNGIYTMGTELHSYYFNIDDVMQNYDSAYAEYVTDKMFLLDVKQANAVYKNSGILGDEYYIGEPTEQCTANSEYTSAYLSGDKKWDYWLRSPYSVSNYEVRYILSFGDVNHGSDAYSSRVGVRPAFYLNTENVSFKSGIGTEGSPYIPDINNSESGDQYDTVVSKNTLKYKNNSVTGDLAFTVYNNTNSEKSARIVTCMYSDNGKLVSLISNEDKVLSKGENDVNLGTLDIVGLSGSSFVIKCFVWDGIISMTPLGCACGVDI